MERKRNIGRKLVTFCLTNVGEEYAAHATDHTHHQQQSWRYLGQFPIYYHQVADGTSSHIAHTASLYAARIAGLHVTGLALNTT